MVSLIDRLWRQAMHKFRKWITGMGQFSEQSNEGGNHHCIRVEGILGFDLTIHVYRHVYTQHFRSQLFTKQRHVVYRVMGLVTGQNPPPEIREAVRQEVCFPDLAPRSSREMDKVNMVVKAYADIITQRIRELTQQHNGQ